MFRYWLNQNNSRIQLINLASLIFLDFDVIFMRLGMDVVEEGDHNYTYCYTVTARITPALKMGSDESHFNV